MRELAVGPIDLAPLVEQGQYLRCFLGQDGVHRRSAGLGVGELSAGPAGVPAVRPNLPEVKHPARSPGRPAGVDRLVDQVQQPGLGGRIDPARDPAT